MAAYSSSLPAWSAGAASRPEIHGSGRRQRLLAVTAKARLKEGLAAKVKDGPAKLSKSTNGRPPCLETLITSARKAKKGGREAVLEEVSEEAVPQEGSARPEGSLTKGEGEDDSELGSLAVAKDDGGNDADVGPEQVSKEAVGETEEVAKGEEPAKEEFAEQAPLHPVHKRAAKELVVQSLSQLRDECDHQLQLLGDATDEDVIHDLRVALRRLRSAVTVFQPFIVLPKAAKAKRISKLLRVLGAVRDADVMQESLGSVEADATELMEEGEKSALAAVRKKMVAERDEMMAAAAKCLRSTGTRKLVRALDEWLESPHFKESAPIFDREARVVVPSLLAPHASSLFLDSAWQIESVDTKEKNSAKATGPSETGSAKASAAVATFDKKLSTEMHDLRKLLRELRYRMELVTHIYDSTNHFSVGIKSVKQLQSVLGDLQDLQVLATYLRPRVSAETPALAKSILERKDKIWSEWLETRGSLGGAKGQRKLYEAISAPKARKSVLLDQTKPKKSEASNGAANVQTSRLQEAGQ